MTNEKGINEMILCKFNKKFEIDKILRLKGYNDHLKQKNWMPLIYNNKICFMYSIFPTIILEPNMDTGICSVIKQVDQVLCPIDETSSSPEESLNILKGLRGNTPILNYDKGYLFIAHIVVKTDYCKYHHPGTYFHRFIYMDNNFIIKKVSPLFYLINKTIEFISGMIYDTDNKNILITFGYEDRKAFIFKISIENINKLLSL